MREILFRGKRVDNGEWVEGFLLSEGVIGYYRSGYDFAFYKVIPETVGQYTGLTDKNEVKVFEGDIVRCEYSSVLRYVEWCHENGALQAIGINSNSPVPVGMPVMSMGYVEIIGNIYDKEVNNV